ncbi:hypothetical protein ORIO_20625 (plasmid) [Cereibacter azotoformans]|uniref:hypothetical protein n=1 Tax=Cereibacter azotoformans TaxID=43057 RepID=UPI001EECCD21|nr:hypothetical protein [Cereibacter azotoformans]ULB12206.1 hypothetical protein ORIO_20625 [Cereibacter azotoformans]
MPARLIPSRLRRSLTILLLVPALALQAGGSLAQAPSEEDLRALRYYRSQNDTPSYEAELRRLRVRFPDWTPPADPLARPGGPEGPSREIDGIYQLIASGAFDAAEARIGETRLHYPGWIPPREMTELLTLSRAQASFDRALVAADPGEAARIAAAMPALLSCERINNPWRLAQAQQMAGATQEAFRLMQGILQTCGNVEHVTATLEKADAFATPAQMAQLFGEARRRFPAQAARWEEIETRLAAGHGRSRPAGSPAGPATGPAPGSAMARAGDPPSPGATTPPSSRVATRHPARCLAGTSPAVTSGQALTRAWCAYDMQRPLEALALFRRAASSGPAEQKRDARFGEALSLLRLGMADSAARIAATTELTRQQRLDVELWILDQRGVSAYQREEYRQAVAFFDAYSELAGFERRDLAILRAYALLNMGKRKAAHAAFQALHDVLASEETRNGLRASAP